MSMGHSLMQLSCSQKKKYDYCLQVLELLSASKVLRRSSSTLKKELSKVKSRQLKNCQHAVPMFSLLLLMHPFDQQVKKLAVRLSPFLDSFGFEFSRVCRLYHLCLRLKQSKNRLQKINLCNHLVGELEHTAHFGGSNSYIP